MHDLTAVHASVQVSDEFTLQLMLKAEHVGRSESTAKRYEYDTCFGPEADQQAVYLETKALIQSAFDGYNVCVFAYGQVTSTLAAIKNKFSVICLSALNWHSHGFCIKAVLLLLADSLFENEPDTPGN